MHGKRYTAAITALLLLFAAVGGAVAAFDTETTDTSTTSDVSGATNTVTADWLNASESLYVETDGVADPANVSLELSPAEKGVDYVAYTNASPDVTNSTAGHAAFNVSYDELDIPRDADGATYNLTVRNESGDAVEQTEVTFQSADGANEDSVIAVTDDAGTVGSANIPLVADRLELEDKSGGLFSMSTLAFWSSSSDDSDTPQIATWSGYTTTNSSASEIRVDLENASTSDAYADAAGDAESGDWVRGMTMWVNGVPQKVYYGSAPDDVDENATTVVYKESSDSLVIDTGENLDTSRTVNIRSTAGSGYGGGEIISNFGWGAWAAGFWPL
jgi:hypothetical protein